MVRVAAIDCGTNSIRLLVADVPEAGTAALTDRTRRMEIVRLGEGVDRTGRISAGALARTRAALADYAGEIRRLGAERVRMVATSASRDAANADEFTAMVVETLGTAPEVLTGDEEAALSYTGAVRGLSAALSGAAANGETAVSSADSGAGGRRTALPPSGGGSGAGEATRDPARSGQGATDLAADVRPPYLVVDIGGGSTEFITGSPDLERAISVDVGCVRMTERHLSDDPPTAAQVAAAEAEIESAVTAALAAVDGQRGKRTLLGLAGSVTTVAAIALGLPSYQSERIHHARISYQAVADVTAELLAMSREQRLALPVMHPGRADVIGAGALILRVVMAQAGAGSVLASEHDILDGIAWSLTVSPPVKR